MRDEIVTLLKLLAKPEPTEQQASEANKLLTDSSVKEDLSKALFAILSDGVERGVLSPETFINLLEDLRKKP